MSDYQLITAIVANMIYIVVLHKLLHIFLVSKRPMKQEILLYAAAYVILTAAYLIWQIPLVTMLANIAVIFALTCFYPAAWPRRLVVAAFVYCIAFVCETFILKILEAAGFAHYTDHSDKEYLIVRILCNLFTYLVALGAAKVGRFKNEAALPAKYWLPLLAVPVMTLVPTCVLLDTVNHDGAVVSAVSVLMLFLLNVLVLYLYDQIIALYQEKIAQVEVREQNRIFVRQLAIEQEASEKMRQMRHDWNNLLQPIVFQLENAEYQEAEADLRQLVGELNHSERLVKSGDPVIAAIINNKLAEAKAKGITISCPTDLPGDLSQWMTVQDLSVLLGNLLDNALRAVYEDTKSCNKYISLKLSIIRGALLIIVVNSYDGQLDLAHGEYQTTKADQANHGLGLKSVRRIVEAYHGDIDIETTDHAFKVRLKLFPKNANT